MFDQITTQPELDRQRREITLEMAEIAGRLLASVDAILVRLPALNLNESQQTTFRVLAGKLRDQAGTLQAQAQKNYSASIPGTVKQIKTTCSSCHALFGKPLF